MQTPMPAGMPPSVLGMKGTPLGQALSFLVFLFLRLFQPLFFLFCFDQMPNGEHGVVEKHPGPGIPHDGPDLFAHVGFIAMHPAVGTEGLALHKGAHVHPVLRIGQKLSLIHIYAGWDYPPKIGLFGFLGPRTCGRCSVTETLFFKVQQQKIPIVFEEALTEKELQTWQRIKEEPESLLDEEEGYELKR